MDTVRIFVQARMSSSRFPGKMLAPFNGKPLVANVVERLAQAGFGDRCVVVTSTDPTDDPLADFVAHRLKVPVFRGDLHNVVSRFQGALEAFPAGWIVRISGDSPVIDGQLVAAVVAHRTAETDLVSNVVRRTFPAGQSVECARAGALAVWDASKLNNVEKEHVTTHFYRNPTTYRIRSVVCQDPAAAQERHVVDTLHDLRMLERGVMIEPQLYSRFGPLAVLET